MTKKRCRVILDINLVSDTCVKGNFSPYVLKMTNEIFRKLINNDKLILEYYKFIIYNFIFEDVVGPLEDVISKKLRKKLKSYVKSEEKIFFELSTQLSKEAQCFLFERYFSPNHSSEDEEIFDAFRNYLWDFFIENFHFKEIKIKKKRKRKSR